MKHKCSVLVLAVLLSLFAVAVRAGSFSAEMVETRRGEVRTGTLHFADGRYRFERVEDGRALVIQIDPAAGTTRIVAPAEKAYRELRSTEIQAAMLNPFAACSFAFEGSALRTEGTAVIEGLPCTKRVLAVRGNDFFVSWTADEFGLPIRVEDRLTQTTVELRNLKRGPQDPALFTVPAGFALKGDPETEPPAWAANLAQSPRLTPPFEKTIKAGEVVRIPLKDGFEITLVVRNPGSDDSTGIALPFKDGRPVISPRGEGFETGAGGEFSTGCRRTPAQADDFVFHTKTGQFTIKAAYKPASAADGSGAAAQPPAPVATKASLQAPENAGVATRIEVGWNGPGADGDFITIASPNQPASAFISRAAVREGNPVKLWAPSDRGRYEIRYTTGRPAKIIGMAPLYVQAADASVGIDESSLAIAAPFAVQWEGPQLEGDFISIAKIGAPPGASEFRVPAKDGNPAKLRAPSVPGEYEIRYVLGRGARVLVKVSVTVTAVEATVEPPATAKAGAEFTVAWTGPDYPEDYLCIVAATTPPNGPTLSAVRANQGNPAKLRAPKQPGAYEIRYILGRGKHLLASAPITIEAP